MATQLIDQLEQHEGDRTVCRHLWRCTRMVLKRRSTRRIGRISRPRRTVGAAFLAMAGAASLSACGGPSATATASQDLAAGIAAQRAGNYGTATTDYSKVLNTEPRNVYALYDLGDVEQFQHQDAAAATHYEQALAVNPKFENALYNLAIIDSKSKPREAKVLYLEVVALYPNDAVARLNLGRVLLTLGEKKAADTQINLAVNLEPSLRSHAPKTS
jgi:tetratricopeptide (TPR) repeat protein